MPKAKPVSLHPLSFDDAIKALIRVDPKSKNGPKKQAKKSKAQGSFQSQSS